MADESIPRRRFLQGAGAVATALSTTLPAEAQPALATERAAAPQAGNEPLLTLTATEAAFLGAAYDTIIPADPLSPSGTDCGLVNYIDRQLAGAWGNGARLYRSGPFIPGKPEQGYQLLAHPARILRRRHQGGERMVAQDLRQGVRPAVAGGARGRAQDHGGRQGRVRRTSTASSSSRRCCNRDGGLLRRPDLRRQPQQGLLADGRLSRPAGGLCRPRRWNIAARRYVIEPKSIADFSLRRRDHGDDV